MRRKTAYRKNRTRQGQENGQSSAEAAIQETAAESPIIAAFSKQKMKCAAEKIKKNNNEGETGSSVDNKLAGQNSSSGESHESGDSVTESVNDQKGMTTLTKNKNHVDEAQSVTKRRGKNNETDISNAVSISDKTKEINSREHFKRGGKKVQSLSEEDALLPSQEVDVKNTKGNKTKIGKKKPMSKNVNSTVEVSSTDDAERSTASGVQDKKATQSLKTQSEKGPVLRRGRKRKTSESELEKEVGGSSSASAADHKVVLVDVAVVLKREDVVSHVLESSSHQKNKVKEVAGGKGRGAKRPRQKDQEAEADKKAAKIPKKAEKKPSKREQIPDVTDIDFSNESKSSKGVAWNYKISSWNVNGIRAWLEKGGLTYLHHENPDIMVIQETKCSEDKLPEDVTEVKGYHTYWLAGDKDGYSGVGLISKEKPMNVKFGIGIKEHDNEGRVITAEYEKFNLVSVYVPNAGKKLVRLDYRMKWDKDFCSYLKKLDQKKPVILCGDLNVAHQEIDLANPKTNKRNAGFTIEEREGFSTLLKEGFTDTFRHFYPDTTGAYTFWTYMMNARAKNVGWRLDYFVVSKRLEENLCDSTIRKDIMGSDHCPIALLLSL